MVLVLLNMSPLVLKDYNQEKQFPDLMNQESYTQISIIIVMFLIDVNGKMPYIAIISEYLAFKKYTVWCQLKEYALWLEILFSKSPQKAESASHKEGGCLSST